MSSKSLLRQRASVIEVCPINDKLCGSVKAQPTIEQHDSAMVGATPAFKPISTKSSSHSLTTQFNGFKKVHSALHGFCREVFAEWCRWFPTPTSRRHAVLGLTGTSLVGMAVVAIATVTDPIRNQLPVLAEDEADVVFEELPIKLESGQVFMNAPLVNEVRVQRGDTIVSILNKLGAVDRDLVSFVQSDGLAKRLQSLRPGRAVTAQLDHAGRLLWLRYWHSAGVEQQHADVLRIERRGERWIALEEHLALERQVEVRSGQIQSSLYGATDAADVPDGIAGQMSEVFAGQIDFHRELKKGDRFRVVYEMLRANGEVVRPGRILAAEFVASSKRYQAFWFSDREGRSERKGGYFDAQGRSLRQSFLRSPLEFSRVTSGFSFSRFHPVLQTWRAHTGVDYGAPTGTPVRATSDGQVSFAGWQNGYGNVVIVKHSGSYSTVYAHLSQFGSGVSKGARVEQGQVVGAVGSTGWATGPHLHYEFRINDVQQDPLTVALPSADPLHGRDLQKFNDAVAQWRSRFDQINLARASVE